MKIGKVYKIVHNQSDICYVGSTFNELKQRFYNHKNSKKNLCVIRKYMDKLGKNNFKMILIKEYKVCDKQHLRTKEQLWINKINCINQLSCIPFLWNDKHRKIINKKYRENNKDKLSKKAKKYYQENKEEMKEKARIYRQENQEKIKERSKRYRENNKEKVKESKRKWRENNKEKKKKHYEDNKEHYKKYKALYYQENKEKMSKKHNTKVICEVCGIYTTFGNLSRHHKTKKHQRNLLKN